MNLKIEQVKGNQGESHFLVKNGKNQTRIVVNDGGDGVTVVTIFRRKVNTIVRVSESIPTK